MLVHHQIPTHINPESRAHLSQVVRTLVAHYQATLLGIVLFGSVARGEERHMRDPRPSDIDLLLIYNQESEPGLEDRLALFRLLGEIATAHPDDLREINVMFATRNLSEWDSYFIEQVARDGIVLYAAAPLPFACAHP